MIIRTGIGQDSHRFLTNDSSKSCILGGVVFEGIPGLSANSDGDVIYHAICNAISSLTGVLILGGIADDLCLKDGITDSRIYLREASRTLGNQRLTHVAITVEAKRPKLKQHFQKIRQNIADILKLDISRVGITATSGEGLTDFGCGDGMQCMCIVTSSENSSY